MRKHAVVIALTVLEVLALLLVAVFELVMRPDFVSMYGLRDPARASFFSWTTRAALSSWFGPVVGGVGLALFSWGWIGQRGVNGRTKVLGAALVWTVFALAAALWSAYAPAFGALNVGG
jgi:hypothetical protein